MEDSVFLDRSVYIFSKYFFHWLSQCNCWYSYPHELVTAIPIPEWNQIPLALLLLLKNLFLQIGATAPYFGFPPYLVFLDFSFIKEYHKNVKNSTIGHKKRPNS